MGQFSTKTRQWLLGVVKQRKLLIRTNRSRKTQPSVENSLRLIEDYLKAYAFDHDVYMARFIRQRSDDISAILPGKGSTGFEKKSAEFHTIMKHAILIEERFNISVLKCGRRQPRYELF